MLTKKYYPYQYERWLGMVDKNYDLYNVAKRLKWSKAEYLGGKWKEGTSKEYAITSKAPTEERVKELAELKGVSIDVAKKYFNKACSCGKKMNSDEVAMFLKLNGRFEDKQDDREYKCKKCLCELLGITAKEYTEKVIEFRGQGCNLF